MEAGVGVMGTKAGMTQVFSEDGSNCDAVTIVGFEDNGNFISMIKTPETDGYNAVQVAYDEGKAKNLSQPETGHLKKAGIDAPLRKLVEYKVKEIPEGYEVGQQLNACEIFQEGDLVDVAGTSIGKGFQGIALSQSQVLWNNPSHAHPSNQCWSLPSPHPTPLRSRIHRTCTVHSCKSDCLLLALTCMTTKHCLMLRRLVS